MPKVNVLNMSGAVVEELELKSLKHSCVLEKAS